MFDKFVRLFTASHSIKKTEFFFVAITDKVSLVARLLTLILMHRIINSTMSSLAYAIKSLINDAILCWLLPTESSKYNML